MKTTISFLHILLLFSKIDFGVSDMKNSSRDGICLSAIPESYDRYTAPFEDGGPANVFVNIKVIELDEINEATMDFRLHAFIRSVWEDPRLLPSRFDMHKDCTQYIWTPDLIFEHSKVIIDIGQNNIFFVVRDDHIYLSQRHSFKVACMMDFHRYPFDTQHCKFSISFMSTDDSEAILKWFDDDRSPYKNKAEAVHFSKLISPLQFVIEPPTTESKVIPFMFTNFTYLYANFHLSRRLTGCIINYYMPSTLLVIISWVTFWLREDATSERVTLIMTALLTICTQGNQYKSELPPVNYITALDIWFFVCIFMLFATLLEFAISSNIYRKKKETQENENQLEELENQLEELQNLNFPGRQGAITGNEKHKENLNIQVPKVRVKSFKKFLSTNEEVTLDSVSKVVFPASFFLFSTVYWAFYLS